MVDTDWREILSFSQKELMQADKEKLCESLSWMEADDIELNFTDLKSLFRLAQDILKYKSEQVNNLHGQLETSQRKTGKGKSRTSYAESPTKSSDSAFETIAHQEEVIKANKEILEQLYADIAELKGQKKELEEGINNADRDSESSRDVLSEMNAVSQLENEVTLKNRHIRKLLSDVKILEEENTKLKSKVSVLNDKLAEATRLIENLTDQLLSIDTENSQLKEALGNSELTKAQLSADIEMLRKELFEKDSNRENIYEEIKSKVHHWKNIVRSKKAEIEALTDENLKLKEDLIQISKPSSSPKVNQNRAEELKIRELQEKLSEATNKIIQSANLIELIKSENKQLKSIIEDTPDFSVSDVKNESDEGKERIIINKLKRKNRNLTISLQGAEEMIAAREKELTQITSQLQLLKTNEGIEKLLEGLKNKKRQLKFKDEGIKTLVKEINTLNQSINELQLENETMRQKLNISPDYKIPTEGILKKYRDMEHHNLQMIKELRKIENKLVTMQLNNRELNTKISKLTNMLIEMGCSVDKIDNVCHGNGSDDNEVMPTDGGGESSTVLKKQACRSISMNKSGNIIWEKDVQELSEENEGLRKGLQEILNFLKDNSTTSSGVLALQCPSLETILQSMEARHAAGWFAPHMAAVMELRTALGGKDALLTALHEARKETFEVMTKLSKESQKSLELEQKLNEVVSNTQQKETKDVLTPNNGNLGEFGTWITEKEQVDINLHDKNLVQHFISKANLIYENQLKNGLVHFHNKFKTLYSKMTSMAIQAEDDKNNWSILEEQYKAQIENLKAQSSQYDEEDSSDISPGLINMPNISSLQRKCSYLEESYKYIRTLNENINNEYLASKRESMMAASDYEVQIQKLMLCVANLTDKLRYSVSIELFWKQNEAFHEIISKYRKVINEAFKQETESSNFFSRLQNDKLEIVNVFQKDLLQNESNEDKNNVKTLLSNIEQLVFSKQLQQVCIELENKNKKIISLEEKNLFLEEAQSKLIDKSLSSATNEDIDLMREQLEKLVEENKILKEQCQHVGSQLDIALLQLQDSQQRHMSNDLEVNMLRHQILDLQSTGDNKAIVARLSGEVLVAHLQASESHKKIERLNSTLNKERELRAEAEEMMRARQKIFDVYSSRYESKFRYMYEVMQVLRHQYQGSLPLISLENYLNNTEDLSRKTHDVNEKLDEIEDLRSSLMAKHSVFNQILDVSKSKCLEDDDSCPHKLQNIVMQQIHSRELDHCNRKLKTSDQSREELLKRCSYLEKTLLHVNQGFDKSTLDDVMERNNSSVNGKVYNLELEDIHSDDENSARKSETITLPKPKLLKPAINNADMTTIRKEDTANIFKGSLVKMSQCDEATDVVNVFVQTSSEVNTVCKIVQTEQDRDLDEQNHYIHVLRHELGNKNKELTEAIALAHQKTEEVMALSAEKVRLQSMIQNFTESYNQKDKVNESLHSTIEDLRKQIVDYKKNQIKERHKTRETVDNENESLLLALRQLEIDKNAIVAEYKLLLSNERDCFSKSVKDLQAKILDLQSHLDRRGSDNNASNGEALKEVISKYTLKIAELEDKCFKNQSELDGYKAELTTYQSEVDRWKGLASERLTKMEHLNSKLEERHSHEVESYKAESDHWMAQLNDTQREHMQLRSRLTEQKAIYMKQLSEKDAHIEQLRSVIHGLKTQIMNMQTMISVSDPSFDLSAIVEVDEGSDVLSQHGSDRLELKFDSSIDLHDMQDDIRRTPAASSSVIWQEPIIERLRREKQLTSKQNAILRRQIKALAARERRARLDAQNLKNQVFRISTSGSKAATAETTSLHTKIASLQAQLMSARRDTHSTVAIWDKWKRSQQMSERWQARYEDKCLEAKKLESSLNLAKSAVTRLEKEKRMLLSRLTEAKSEKLVVVEKQESEQPEKVHTPSEYACSDPPVSARALLERVQAQQRRIAALEVAEKGNEHLVSEYEKSLAEVTSLKGQVLKLESTLLESQIRSPLNSAHDPQPELEYWKSYCEMLKDENVQLNLRVNSMETAPTTANQHRINDLEQTVLTLRGLVSKLQADQKSGTISKRPESRPSSGLSGADNKNRNQLDSHRIEIANLKRSIQDKDLLLEKSKEMLKIAAEREDYLLRENTSLRRQIDELNKFRGGFLSA